MKMSLKILFLWIMYKSNHDIYDKARVNCYSWNQELTTSSVALVIVWCLLYMEQSSQGCTHSKFRSLDDFKKKTHSRFCWSCSIPTWQICIKTVCREYIFYRYTDILTVYNSSLSSSSSSTYFFGGWWG